MFGGYTKMPETSIVTYCWLGAWNQPKVAVYIEWLVQMNIFALAYQNTQFGIRFFLLSIATFFFLFSGIFVFTVIANNYFYPFDTGKTDLCIYELISSAEVLMLVVVWKRENGNSLLFVMTTTTAMRKQYRRV